MRLTGQRALQARTLIRSVTSPHKPMRAGHTLMMSDTATGYYFVNGSHTCTGGEGGIRTHERGSPVTRFRVVRFHPLSHLSALASSCSRFGLDTGAPGLIRTGDLQLRRLLLYPSELRGRGLIGRVCLPYTGRAVRRQSESNVSRAAARLTTVSLPHQLHNWRPTLTLR